MQAWRNSTYFWIYQSAVSRKFDFSASFFVFCTTSPHISRKYKTMHRSRWWNEISSVFMSHSHFRNRENLLKYVWRNQGENLFESLVKTFRKNLLFSYSCLEVMTKYFCVLKGKKKVCLCTNYWQIKTQIRSSVNDFRSPNWRCLGTFWLKSSKHLFAFYIPLF